MRQKFATNNNNSTMTPGVSQTSLKSTNPFDDEEDNGSVIGLNGSVRTSTPARRYRKKRPAPPPPVQSKFVSFFCFFSLLVGFCDYINVIFV